MTRQTRLQGRPASGMTANLVSRARYAFGQRRHGDLMTKGTPGDEVAARPVRPTYTQGTQCNLSRKLSLRVAEPSPDNL